MSSWQTSDDADWVTGADEVAGSGGGIGPYLASYAVSLDGPPVLNGRVVADLDLADRHRRGAGLVCRADAFWTFVAFYTAPVATDADHTAAWIGVFEEGRLTPLARLATPVRLEREANRFSLEFYSGQVRGEIRAADRTYELTAACANVPFPGRAGIVKLYRARVVARGVTIHATEMPFATSTDRTRRNHEFDVFLCYSSKDVTRVGEVAQALKARGIRYWLDVEQINFGDGITRQIEDGLRRSRYLVPCLSENLTGSAPWARAEYGAVLNAELSGETGRTVVPLSLDDRNPPDIPFLLRDKRRVSYANKVEFEQFIQFLLRR